MHWSWRIAIFITSSAKHNQGPTVLVELPFHFYLAAYLCRCMRKFLLNGGTCKLPSRVASSIGYTGRIYFATLPNSPKPIPNMIRCHKLKSHKRMLWGPFRSHPISEARDTGVQACTRSQIKGRSRGELPERGACRSRPSGDHIPCKPLAVLLPLL